MEILVYEEEPGRWVYLVDANYQPFDPELPGHVPMSEARARELANETADRIRALAEQDKA